MKLSIIKFFILLIFISCRPQNSENDTTVGELGWLSGTTDEKLEEVAYQLGGFSHKMREVSYRYQELYWAGMDENWEYADYQVEHIIEAIEAGVKRRPERLHSAEEFMDESIPVIASVLELKDKSEFLRGFTALMAGCNGCHAKENVSFIMIKEPQNRTSPVGLY